MKYLIAAILILSLVGIWASVGMADEPEQILLVKGKAHGKVLKEIKQLDIKVVKGHKKDQIEADWVEEDGYVEAYDTPNDPYYPQQWAYPVMDCPQAWDMSTGEGVVIAILDTGIDMDHPDIGSQIIGNVNFTLDGMDDVHGHGTHVAGIAAGITNNGIGIAGTARDADILDVKVLNDNGMGPFSTVAEGIVWAADNGADVINMSLGGPNYSQAMQDACTYAWDHGVVIVTAAGNEYSETPHYPAANEHVIAVAATDQSDQLAYFSSHGDWVDVAAPGYQIMSTVIGGYGQKNGTSMACPYVSGIVAMLLTEGVGYDQVENRLETTSENNGRLLIESGRVNAYYALTGYQPPMPPPLGYGTFSGRVTDRNNGQPIGNAEIYGHEFLLYTDESGYFQSGDILEGHYGILCSASGYIMLSTSVDIIPNINVVKYMALWQSSPPPTTPPPTTEPPPTTPPPTTPPPTTEPPPTKTKKEPPAWGKGGKPK